MLSWFMPVSQVELLIGPLFIIGVSAFYDILYTHPLSVGLDPELERFEKFLIDLLHDSEVCKAGMVPS